MSGPMQWTPRGLVPALTFSPTSGSIPREPPPIVGDDREDDDLDDEAVVRATPAAKPTGAPAPAQKRRPQQRVTDAPPNVLKLARDRLRYLEREIKKRQKFEQEAVELRRLLEAAKAKPRAIVRALPTKQSAG